MLKYVFKYVDILHLKTVKYIFNQRLFRGSFFSRLYSPEGLFILVPAGTGSQKQVSFESKNCCALASLCHHFLMLFEYKQSSLCHQEISQNSALSDGPENRPDFPRLTRQRTESLS
jgi:hypothetical protein